MSIKPKKETQMDLLKKYLQEEKFGSLKVTVQRKEGRKKERKKESHVHSSTANRGGL